MICSRRKGEGLDRGDRGLGGDRDTRCTGKH